MKIVYLRTLPKQSLAVASWWTSQYVILPRQVSQSLKSSQYQFTDPRRMKSFADLGGKPEPRTWCRLRATAGGSHAPTVGRGPGCRVYQIPGPWFEFLDQVTQAFHPPGSVNWYKTWLGELNLTRPSAGHRKSLYKLQIVSEIACRSRVRGIFQNGLANSVDYP